MNHIQEINSEELQKVLEKDNHVEVIDVREDEEVAQGIIGVAKHIPMQEIPERLDDLSKDKEYVIVCRSGNRSMRVATFLDEQGFKVTNLAGGMLDWDGEVVF